MAKRRPPTLDSLKIVGGQENMNPALATAVCGNEIVLGNPAGEMVSIAGGTPSTPIAHETNRQARANAQ